MYQEVFQRYEKKYLVSIGQYQELISRMITKLTPDQYGKHTICNIYLDTADHLMIRRSLEKPVYKEKLRLRSYGVPTDEETVFLEIKKKYDGVVYKRRTPLAMGEVRRYLYDKIHPAADNQVLREFDYAMNFYGARPAVYLAYDRIAFSGRENPKLRVTFDMNIRAREHHLDLCWGSYGALLLEKKEILMEVKIPGAMPVWMSRLFAQLGIYPASYSKYGAYYQKYMVLQPASERAYGEGCGKWKSVKGGVVCA